jgi:hypothetical protein
MKISKKKYPGGDLNQGPKLRSQSSLSAIHLPAWHLPASSPRLLCQSPFFLYTGASLTGVGRGCDQRVLFNSLTAKSIPAGTKKQTRTFEVGTYLWREPKSSAFVTFPSGTNWCPSGTNRWWPIWPARSMVPLGNGGPPVGRPSSTP